MENNMFNYIGKEAAAKVKGNKNNSNIEGNVLFKQKGNGVLVTAEIRGLPYSDGKCTDRIFALHIHDGTSCTGNSEDLFANVGSHYNPDGCKHPMHAGDLPPLFCNRGYAYLSTYTERFKIKDILGKVIIIHDEPDDFTTQPSGNSGEKIACGVIKLL